MAFEYPPYTCTCSVEQQPCPACQAYQQRHRATRVGWGRSAFQLTTPQWACTVEVHENGYVRVVAGALPARYGRVQTWKDLRDRLTRQVPQLTITKCALPAEGV